LIIITPTALGQNYSSSERDGIYAGFSLGSWVPDRSKNVFKNPLMFGLMGDIRRNDNAFGFSFDMIFGFKTEEFEIDYLDSLLVINSFGGGSLTFDYSREFWSWDRYMLEGICGLGYGNLSFSGNSDKDIDISKSSIVLNPGLSFRCLIGEHKYLQLKGQYTIANYNPKQNTGNNLRGNFFVAKLIFGDNYNKD
jgi:hypothetical protein